MNMLLLKPRTKLTIKTSELIEYLKSAKFKTVSVQLSADQKSLLIEVKD
jgi:hypothetical protein